MDIDRFYRAVGSMFKRVWHQYFSRPVKNFNVDNRAQKVIESNKPKAAPWHDTTKQVIDSLKKESNFEKYNQFDAKLADRLKSVKVVSKDVDVDVDETANEPKSKLPVDRIGIAMPYVFLKPEFVPSGKIAVLDALDMLLNHQKEKTPVKEMAKTYDLTEENVEKILKYVDLFKAVNKENKEITMAYLDEEITEAARIEEQRYVRVNEVELREERKKAQAAAREAAAKAKGEQATEEPTTTKGEEKPAAEAAK